MSAELEYVGDVAQVMLERDAWHRAGIVVGEKFSWADAVAQDLAITFPVYKVALEDVLTPLPTTDGQTLRAQSDDHVAVRSDGLVVASGLGAQWTPFHASEGYAFGEAIRDEASDQVNANLLSLGTLYNGRVWFMTFDLGDFYIGEYQVRDYLVASGSYDSSRPLSVNSGPTLVVCANTLAASDFGMKHFRFKHTSGIFDRVKQAKKALGIHNANRDILKTKGETLLSTPVSGSQYSTLVKAMFPIEDDTIAKTRNVHEAARATVTELYRNSPYVSGADNGFAFVQAVNTYENWAVPVRMTKGRNEADTRTARQIEAVFGGGQPLTNRAIELVGALN
jgi:phage/plasmid-like protein (TIGR03299 family)